MDQDVVLSLDDSGDARARRTLDRAGRWAPAASIDGVVRGLDECAGLGCPLQSEGAAKWLPAGDVAVAAVEHEEAAEDLGGVLGDGQTLVEVEPAVTHVAGEVVLPKGGGAGRETPGLHQWKLLRRRQVRHRRQRGRGRVDRPQQPAPQLRRSRTPSAVASEAGTGGGEGLPAPHQHSEPVALDESTDLLALGDRGGHRHGVHPRATDALLDPVLAKQCRQFGPQGAGVLAVHGRLTPGRRARALPRASRERVRPAGRRRRGRRALRPPTRPPAYSALRSSIRPDESRAGTSSPWIESRYSSVRS